MLAGAVDTHVHVFRKDSLMAADRRYTPDGDALPATLRARMDASGVTQAVLVQPSFLGTDNTFLLKAIERSDGCFIGVAVVDPDIRLSQLADLRRAGVVGVRLNCIGNAPPDLRGTHRNLITHLCDLGMVLQLQAETDQWPILAPALAEAEIPVVIDHFGRTPAGHASGGFECLLRAAARSRRIWFKFSAPYRFGEAAARACAATILSELGAERVVWGSDWPHTQFEGRVSYGETHAWLADWLPDAVAREQALRVNPGRLFPELVDRTVPTSSTGSHLT
jgi:predicted TIM-barrel fold metal-dependent hydrolase